MFEKIIPRREPAARPADKRPQIEFHLSGDGRFGILNQGGTKLTFSDCGTTNNTRLWVDGRTPLFDGGKPQILESHGSQPTLHQCSGSFEGVEVVQQLRIVEGMHTGEWDTVQIQYWLTNRTTRSREVGIRIMLDTYIGNNDGVPFIVPGRDGLVDRQLVVDRPQMPEFIQALERPDFIQPGLVVSLTLRGNDSIPPDRLVLSRWPGSGAEWDYVIADIGHDSAVGLYYRPHALAPGERRPVILHYGLGGLSSASSGNTRLALILPKVLPVGQEGTVVVLVRDPQPGQQVSLTVQPPLALAYGQTPLKPVRCGGPASYCELAWRVQALDAHLEAARVQARLEPAAVLEQTMIAIVPKR